MTMKLVLFLVGLAVALAACFVLLFWSNAVEYVVGSLHLESPRAAFWLRTGSLLLVIDIVAAGFSLWYYHYYRPKAAVLLHRFLLFIWSSGLPLCIGVLGPPANLVFGVNPQTSAIEQPQNPALPSTQKPLATFEVTGGSPGACVALVAIIFSFSLMTIVVSIFNDANEEGRLSIDRFMVNVDRKVEKKILPEDQAG